jgi:hypothetical protein
VRVHDLAAAALALSLARTLFGGSVSRGGLAAAALALPLAGALGFLLFGIIIGDLVTTRVTAGRLGATVSGAT